MDDPSKLIEIGGVPLAKPDATFRIDFGRHQREQDQRATDSLALKRKAFVGVFDTGLRCNCGKSNIADHATENDQTARRQDPMTIRFGPGPSLRDQDAAFRAYHAYSCDECGAVFKNDVIEGKRGYVRREKQPEFEAIFKASTI